MYRQILKALMILAVSFTKTDISSQTIYKATKDSSKVPRQPYLRYFTTDKYERKITFYISEVIGPAKLPLVVYVQGSGANSHFIMHNEQLIPVNGHIYITESLNNKARLLIVEKPGVKYLDNPRDPQKNDAFNKEHSLDRWSEAIEASIKATVRAGLADSNKIMVIGHSEGGLVASKLARDLDGRVTHVANLAGGGDSQLYDLLVMARKGNFFKNISEDPASRVRYVHDEWKKILADPFNTNKFFFGLSYLRWSSFMQTSCIEQLENCKANILIVQGFKDENLDPASADQLYAHLLSKGKNVTYHRLDNADHSFKDATKPNENGWKIEMQKILDWFLSR